MKCQIAVTAGVLPGQAEKEHTKVWSITSEDWEKIVAGDAGLWDRAMGEAVMYSTRLMNPRQLNWVRLDWTWF